MSSSCWGKLKLRKFWKKSLGRYTAMSTYDSDSSLGEEDDPLMWCRDIEKHFCGDLSYAAVQANVEMEDCSQVETGREATFAGIYDGHGGHVAASFIRDHLFRDLIRISRRGGAITESTIQNAFFATEMGFLSVVRKEFAKNPLIAANGSCCLVGILYKGTLYVANLGDSRAVLGIFDRARGRITSYQLSTEHNASIPGIRNELMALHPEDPDIVVNDRGAWRVKGIIQITRSIGDAYLKRGEFALTDVAHRKFHLPSPITRPVLKAEPSINTRRLLPDDQFVIFASDGLWEHLSNEKAVQIVHRSPRQGIARRLIKAALAASARKTKTPYEDFKKYGPGLRRPYHDDISVIVIFIDHHLLDRRDQQIPLVSLKSFRQDELSDFCVVQDEGGSGAKDKQGKEIELVEVTPKTDAPLEQQSS